LWRLPEIGELIDSLGGEKTDGDAVWIPYSPEDARFSFRLTVPKRDWKESEDARAGLNAFVALTRSDPEVWLAVAAKDFAGRQAGPGEMQENAVDRLKAYFQAGVECELRPGMEELAGQPARTLVFKGERDNVVRHGACYMLQCRGIGYWVFVWANSVEIARKQLADLQKEQGKGFVLPEVE
jgi:hypothetical protein